MPQIETAAGIKYGGKVVIYTTSVTGIRDTYARCTEVRKIFQNLRVAFEDRNIYMSSEFAKELDERLPKALVPQLFFNGKYVGVRPCARAGEGEGWGGGGGVYKGRRGGEGGAGEGRGGVGEFTREEGEGKEEQGRGKWGGVGEFTREEGEGKEEQEAEAELKQGENDVILSRQESQE